MTIEIDTEQVVEELTDDRTFTSWVDERIDERLPDEDRFVTSDNFDDALRNVIRNNGAAHFDLAGTGHEHDDHTVDEEYLNQHLINVLDSLPRGSDERCTLGRAFERAVLKVLTNVLAGAELVTEGDGNLDGALAAMVERVVPGAITTRMQPAYVVPAHTDEDGTDDPEPAYRAPTEQVYDFATRKCVEVYVNSALPNERVCDVVYEAMREQFGTRGNPSVTVESVGVQRLS